MASKLISKRWCFTVNNHTSEDEELFQNLDCQCIVCGREVGDNGTPHMQGFVTFKSMKRFSGMKKIHGTAHFEVANGASLQAASHCKKDGDFF